MFSFNSSLPTVIYSQKRLLQLPQIAVKATEYNILEKPSLFRQRLLELIRSAEKRIMMTLLYLQDDEAGREIMNALYEAGRKNPKLHIRIYVDYHRAQRGLIGKEADSTNADMYRSFASQTEHPPAIYGVPVKRRELFGVLHLKGIVIDDTVLYSGASLNNVYLKMLDNYRLDRYHEIVSKELADSMCKYTNEVFHFNYAVQDFSQGKVRNVRELKSEIKELQRRLSNFQYSFIGCKKLQSDEIGITPIAGLGKKNNPLNRVILWTINSARECLFICTPYFNPPKVLQDSIEQALQRNVEVTIVVGDKKANDFYIKEGENFSSIGAVPYVYEQNLRNFVMKFQDSISSGLLKIRLWENGNNTYHLKGIFADRRTALVTGNNLNPRAWALDLENGLLINDPHHLMLEKFMHEQQYIMQYTHSIMSADEIDSFDSYPEAVQKILTRVQRFCASFLLKKLL